MIIAIDGPAASGKGTLARRLADVLNLRHMDTGALYRGCAFEVLQAKGDPSNEQDALKGCKKLKEKIQSTPDLNIILGNPELRNDKVGNAASKLASISSVRETLKSIQIDFSCQEKKGFNGVILDGRDIGTVICPNAHIKFYVEADLETRAKRRLKELQSRGLDVTYNAVFAQMRERDDRDTQRDTAPLRAAEDAIVINTSDFTEDEVLEKALAYAKKVRGL
ncbi:MAG: (d)CMP kinase [Alphaproteobacteria bacterium]|nr:(d)CMP kinase [Alphaproteobacteria bacterium]